MRTNMPSLMHTHNNTLVCVRDYIYFMFVCVCVRACVCEIGLRQIITLALPTPCDWPLHSFVSDLFTAASQRNECPCFLPKHNVHSGFILFFSSVVAICWTPYLYLTSKTILHIILFTMKLVLQYDKYLVRNLSF